MPIKCWFMCHLKLSFWEPVTLKTLWTLLKWRPAGECMCERERELGRRLSKQSGKTNAKQFLKHNHQLFESLTVSILNWDVFQKREVIRWPLREGPAEPFFCSRAEGVSCGPQATNRRWVAFRGLRSRFHCLVESPRMPRRGPAAMLELGLHFFGVQNSFHCSQSHRCLWGTLWAMWQ